MVQLDEHIDRLFKGIQSIKITNLPFTREELKEILIKTVGFSGCENGAYKYFLGAGEENGSSATFYVIVEDGIPVKPINGTKDL